MMKMKNRVILFFFVLLLLGGTYLVNYLVPYKVFYSSSIEESIKNGLYLEEYEVYSISNDTINDFCDCLNNAEIWKEKMRLKKVFFYPIATKTKSNEILIIKPPSCSKWSNIVSFPFIRLEGYMESGVIRENNIIALEKSSKK